MNLGQLRAAVGRNKAVLGVAGAAIVAALAWRSRSAKASTSTSAASDASTGLASYGAGYQTSAATGYDSTASDVYNAIQPQIEQTQEMLQGLRTLWENPTPPTPVPADPDEPTVLADPDPSPVSVKPLIDLAGTRSWVRGLYLSTLGRNVSEPDLDIWMSRFESGTLTRPELETHLQTVAGT